MLSTSSRLLLSYLYIHNNNVFGHFFFSAAIISKNTKSEKIKIQTKDDLLFFLRGGDNCVLYPSQVGFVLIMNFYISLLLFAVV